MLYDSRRRSRAAFQTSKSLKSLIGLAAFMVSAELFASRLPVSINSLDVEKRERQRVPAFQIKRAILVQDVKLKDVRQFRTNSFVEV